MDVVSAGEMLLRATEGKYAVGAFNVANIAQMETVVEAAERKQAPLILQTSVTPARFLGGRVIGPGKGLVETSGCG